MKKRALITGITGMDGSHLADFLLTKNYDVFGLERWRSNNDYVNVKHILDKIQLLKGDLSDQNSITRCVKECEPHEIYNFAAESFVGTSWALPEQTSNITGLGVLRMLESIREVNKNIKFYQASSSEMFGITYGITNETGILKPISPYGVAKVFGHLMTKNYRDSYNIFAVSGILFNHESERRGLHFVTRKITHGVAKIKLGLSENISLGNIDAKRDWGYAPDFIEGIWNMMQLDEPDDFVLASGITRSIRDFLDSAFLHIGIADWSEYINIDSNLFRPVDNNLLWGDYSKAQSKFNWTPKTEFDDWVGKMVDNDIKLLIEKNK